MKGQENCLCLGGVNDVAPQAVLPVIEANKFSYIGG